MVSPEKNFLSYSTRMFEMNFYFYFVLCPFTYHLSVGLNIYKYIYILDVFTKETKQKILK